MARSALVNCFWKTTITSAKTISTGTSTSSAEAGETSSRSAPAVAPSVAVSMRVLRCSRSAAISRR